MSAVTSAVRRSYPCRAASVGQIRSDVVALLFAWELEKLAVDAELCVSELAGNAVRHRPEGGVGGEVMVSVEVIGGRRLRLAVHDRWPGAPKLRPVEESAESGRGLWLVAAVAADWGVAHNPSGKAVWCELRMRPLSRRHFEPADPLPVRGQRTSRVDHEQLRAELDHPRERPTSPAE